MSLPEVKPKIKENHCLFLGPSPTFLPSFRECKPPLIVNIPNKSLNQNEFLVHDGTLPQNQNSQFTREKMVAKEDGPPFRSGGTLLGIHADFYDSTISDHEFH